MSTSKITRNVLPGIKKMDSSACSLPPEELGSDGQNAGEILGHSERWSNRPLVSGSIDGKSTTSIRVVN